MCFTTMLALSIAFDQCNVGTFGILMLMNWTRIQRSMNWACFFSNSCIIYDLFSYFPSFYSFIFLSSKFFSFLYLFTTKIIRKNTKEILFIMCIVGWCDLFVFWHFSWVAYESRWFCPSKWDNQNDNKYASTVLVIPSNRTVYFGFNSLLCPSSRLS